MKYPTVVQDDMGLDLDEDGEDYNEEDSGVESGFGRYGNITRMITFKNKIVKI